MNYLYTDVVLQECPNEVSLTFSPTGCPNRCPGCHTPEVQDANNWVELTDWVLLYHIKKNKWISCVLFYGGEWEEERLMEMISLVKKEGLKTCLYTGSDSVGEKLFNALDYIKTWPYIEELWALSSPTTNQKMVNTKTLENLNHYFLKD